MDGAGRFPVSSVPVPEETNRGGARVSRRGGDARSLRPSLEVGDEVRVGPELVGFLSDTCYGILTVIIRSTPGTSF